MAEEHHLPPESPSPPPPQQQQSHHHSPPPPSFKMSPDHNKCPHQHNKHAYSSSTYNSQKSTTSDSYRALCTFLTILLLILGATALTLWLIYRPHKPHFTVVAAAIYSLNATSSSSPSLISTTMQFTIVTRNPNRRVSIRYDTLKAFVAYRNMAITQEVMLPPLMHGRHSSVAVSPVLGGVAVPVSTEVVNGLVMDEAYGVVRLTVVVVGKLRWKVTGLDIKTRRYGIHVNCDVLVGLKQGFVGQVPLLGTPACKVDV